MKKDIITPGFAAHPKIKKDIKRYFYPRLCCTPKFLHSCSDMQCVLGTSFARALKRRLYQKKSNQLIILTLGSMTCLYSYLSSSYLSE